MDGIVRLHCPLSGDSQCQKTFLALSAEKQTRNYETECSKYHRSLSTLKLKDLSHSRMKWWPIYTNFPMDTALRIPALWSGDSQNKETFLAASVGNERCNYHTEWPMVHSSLSTLNLKGLSLSKMKSWAIYTNLLVDSTVRLPNPQRKDSQVQETFLAPSANKQTHNYYKECSHHNYSLSTLRVKWFGRSKMKWWAIYTNYECQRQTAPFSERR